MTEEVLIIFMKIAEKGKVKTRLATSVGDDSALEVYKKLLLHSRSVVEKLPVDRHLYFTGATSLGKEWNDSTFTPFRQEGADLGERMLNSFRNAFDDSYKKAVVIGTDCYDLSPEVLTAAFAALDQHDLVIGPAADGGYYLLGMNKLHEPLFQNKNWGSAHVLEQTLADSSKLQLNCKMLPTLSDIDTLEDLLKSRLSEEFSLNPDKIKP